MKKNSFKYIFNDKIIYEALSGLWFDFTFYFGGIGERSRFNTLTFRRKQNSSEAKTASFPSPGSSASSEVQQGKRPRFFAKGDKMLFILIIAVGFIYRYIGILKQLSFWNDENHTALFARSILEKGIPITSTGNSTGIYQVAYYYLTAFSFKIWGVNEFAGRLPSVIAGTLLIFIVGYFTYKLLGRPQAIIASFLTAFTQIQLAWSTQLRPYIFLELLTLLVLYFGYKSLQNKKNFNKDLGLSILFAFTASLFHGTGMINIIFIAIFISISIYKKQKSLIKSTLSCAIVLLTGLLLLQLTNAEIIYRALFQYNFDFLHYRIFFTHNYLWLLIGSLLGLAFLYKTNKNLSLLLAFVIGIIVFTSIIKFNPRYVRYCLPCFPLLYILFSHGFVMLINKLNSFSNRIHSKIFFISTVSCLFFLWPLLNDKILFMPKHYYTINADMRENPIVDYKETFRKIKVLINSQDNLIVMDAWNDRVPYYLPKQKYIFLVKSGRNQIDSMYGEKMIGTIDEFKQEKIKYKRGVVIVENWESMTPWELQNYIKTNLKHEFDINNLPYNDSDKWGISVYSWGL